MARPKMDFDWSKLDAILQYKASLTDCAEIMGTSQSTIEKRIKKERGVNFSEYRDKKMSRTRLTLTQKAIDMAKSGNVTMMIFCLKNLCGWSDRYEDAPVAAQEVRLVIDRHKD